MTHTPRSRRRGAARARRGFSIVELIVGVALLSIGVLALAGTSAIVARLLQQGGQQVVVANVAQSRFELMRAQRCPVVAGSGTTQGVRERWIVLSGSTATRLYSVLDTVTYTVRGRDKRQAYRSVVRCQP